MFCCIWASIPLASTSIPLGSTLLSRCPSARASHGVSVSVSVSTQEWERSCPTRAAPPRARRRVAGSATDADDGTAADAGGGGGGHDGSAISSTAPDADFLKLMQAAGGNIDGQIRAMRALDKALTEMLPDLDRWPIVLAALVVLRSESVKLVRLGERPSDDCSLHIFRRFRDCTTASTQEPGLGRGPRKRVSCSECQSLSSRREVPTRVPTRVRPPPVPGVSGDIQRSPRQDLRRVVRGCRRRPLVRLPSVLNPAGTPLRSRQLSCSLELWKSYSSRARRVY